MLHLARFLDPYYVVLKEIRWLPDGHASSWANEVTVPVGFVTDLASIPRVFWSLLRPDGDYIFAAVVHDYLYWDQRTSREHADEVFRLAMRDLNVDELTIGTIYEAVRLGGRASWVENARLRHQGERRVLKRLPSDARVRWVDWKTGPDVFK